MSSQGYAAVSEMLGDEREHRRKIAQKVNTILGGKVNCTIDVVVTASATTTTITDPRISYFSFLSVMAFDATGAADIVAGIYFSTFNSGSVVMNHRSAAGVRSLRVCILG